MNKIILLIILIYLMLSLFSGCSMNYMCCGDKGIHHWNYLEPICNKDRDITMEKSLK
jgi:hypothetical protein